MRSIADTNPGKAPSKNLLCLIICQVGFLFAISQTSNISGIINSYYRVIEVIPSKACVRLNTVSGLSKNQKVLLVQMKGASVTTTNTSSFGDTTALNNAGNYEVAIICSMNGDSVFMYHNLLNSYTVSDKVQLVKFASYYAATVTDTLKASPWNNSSGTGGVIALTVSTDLTLNAPIYADSVGFSGGAYVLSDGTCFNFPSANAYIYDASQTAPQNGAYKGESVYAITVAGQTGGRGAPANGGGGGNNHNNGGGGGANLAAGGIGGGNSSSAGCTVTLRGEAGKALSSWGGKKIFFGGGGGAGHSNGTLTISDGGGNGGGIIFIHAGNIIGNGKIISANGGAGGNAVSDGASGGGGGGTIIMDAASYSGSLTVQANGGKGGDEDDVGTVNRCYGGGGGGSGGVIYFTGATPAITVSTTGGVAGSETGRNSGCLAMVAAVNGSNGSTVASYSVRQSTDSSSYCLSIGPLANGLISFYASSIGTSIQLGWKITNSDLMKSFVVEKWSGTRWYSIKIIDVVGQVTDYGCADLHPVFGTNLYRLRIIYSNNSVSFSPTRQVNLRSPNDQYTIAPNPATDKLVLTGDFRTPTTVRLFTVTGKICLQKEFMSGARSVTLELPPLEAGVYSLQVNNVVKKLVIRK